MNSALANRQLFGRRTGLGSPLALVRPSPVFPNGIAGDLNLAVAGNRLQTALAASLSATATSMTVTDASQLVAGMLLSIDDEIVQVTAPPAGTTVTVARGFDGTTPALHLANATVSGFVDAFHHNALMAEIEAIETALGPHLANVPGLQTHLSTAFNFPAQSPGGSLIAGANSITLTPVPPGVNGTDVGHYVYISNGTGAPEAALITGGNAVSGSPTGNLIIQCANAHSGAWTITSATAGIQEATQSAAAGLTGGQVFIAPGVSNIYATITVPNSTPVAYQGGGPWVSQMNIYFSGDVFYANGNACLAEWQDFSMGAVGSIPATGFGIHIAGNNAGWPYVRRVYINNLYGGVWHDNGQKLFMDSVWYEQSLYNIAPFAMLKVTGHGAAIHCVNCAAMVDTAGSNVMSFGYDIEAADGITILGGIVFQALEGARVFAAAGAQIGSIIFDSVIFDTCGQNAFQANVSGTPALFVNVKISNCHLIGTSVNYDSTYGAALNINGITSLDLVNNWIMNAQGHGATISNCNYLKLHGNKFADNGRAGAGFNNASGLLIYNSANITVENNQFWDDQATPTQKFAWSMDNTVLGQFRNNVVSLSNTMPPRILPSPGTWSATGLDVSSNYGVDVGVLPATLASASSVTLGFNNTYYVTGTTPIATIAGGLESRQISLIFTNAAPGGLATGGNIGRAQTAVQNQKIVLVFDGTNWY